MTDTVAPGEKDADALYWIRGRHVARGYAFLSVGRIVWGQKHEG